MVFCPNYVIMFHKRRLFQYIYPCTAPQHGNLLQKPILEESSFCKRNVYALLRFLFTKITAIICLQILKLVPAIFYKIFIFSPNVSPLKTIKNVKALKSSFRSEVIQILVISSFLFTFFRFKRTNKSGIIFDVMNWFA